MKSWIILFLLAGCQAAQQPVTPVPSASAASASSQASPTPQMPVSPSPCAGEQCQVVDATVHQTGLPASVCAGETLRITLGNLKKVDPEAKTVSLIIVSNPNHKQNLPPGEKGTPPALTFGAQDIELASAPVSAEGSAVLQAQLATQYGPDPSGKLIELKPGDSNGLLYLRLGGGYSSVNTRLCPEAN